MTKAEKLCEILNEANERRTINNQCHISIFQEMENYCPSDYGMEDDCITDDCLNSYDCFKCWMKEYQDECTAESKEV